MSDGTFMDRLLDDAKAHHAHFAALVDAANLDEAGPQAELLAEFSEATRTLQAVCPHLLMRREGRPSCLAITWKCDCCGKQHVPVGMRARSRELVASIVDALPNQEQVADRAMLIGEFCSPHALSGVEAWRVVKSLHERGFTVLPNVMQKHNIF